MITFTKQTMQEILPILQNLLKDTDSITFSILNPDYAKDYAGQKIEINNQIYLYRGYKAWTDLA